MKKIIITESQYGRLSENLLMEVKCPKGLVYDNNLESCVFEKEFSPTYAVVFKNDPDGKIKEAYDKYYNIYTQLEELYRVNGEKLDTKWDYKEGHHKPSVKLFNTLTNHLTKKYKEEYENFDSIRRARFIEEEVRPLVGKPYVWGEEGPECLDCSGVICAVFEQPRRTANSYYNMANLFTDINQLKVGDIVFFDYDPNNPKDEKPIDHVGIISDINGGKIKMIHASGGERCSLEKYEKGKLPSSCRVKEVRYGNKWLGDTAGFGRFVGFDY
jgi:hypothetical protein